MPRISQALGLIVGFSLLLNALSIAAQDLPADLPCGKALYLNHCATCHGQTAWATVQLRPHSESHQRTFINSDSF